MSAEACTIQHPFPSGNHSFEYQCWHRTEFSDQYDSVFLCVFPTHFPHIRPQ